MIRVKIRQGNLAGIADAEKRRVLAKVANKILAELEDNTPVDTGFAREAWVLDKQSLSTYSLTNSAEYIEYLNSGSSKQAPAFFIEAVLLKHGRPLGALVTYK